MKLPAVHTAPDCGCLVCRLTAGTIVATDTTALFIGATHPSGADGPELVDAYRAALLQSALVALAIPHDGEAGNADQRVEAAVEWLRDNLDRVRLRRKIVAAMDEAATATKQ